MTEMTLPGALNQIHFPGVGDVDDCWVVATIWAAQAAGVIGDGDSLPTIKQFRTAAGDPDDGQNDAGSLDEVMRGARQLWPDSRVTRVQSTAWNRFRARILGGAIASLQLDSSRLPLHLQHGFGHPTEERIHQVGLAFDGKRLVLMNPLQQMGAAPQRVANAVLREAATAPFGGEVRAALFPAATEATMPHVLVGNQKPRRLDIATGVQLFDLDLTPAVKVSNVHGASSPFGVLVDGIRYRVCFITTDQEQRVLLVRSSQATDTPDD
jgi:hypothetical protein